MNEQNASLYNRHANKYATQQEVWHCLRSGLRAAALQCGSAHAITERRVVSLLSMLCHDLDPLHFGLLRHERKTHMAGA